MQNFRPGKAINQSNLGYKAFLPTEVNRPFQIDDAKLLKKLGIADRFIGRLDAFSDLVDINLFVRLHVTKEATLSAKIEGTQTSIQEALMDRQDISLERRDDWEEVNNYVDAINYAVNELSRLPISSRLIRNTHKILLKGVRGQTKSPGEFRTSQNWIGGTTLNSATFIPPPHNVVGDLMSDLEKLLNNDENDLPELLKIALVHYQFETIHPFQDGNGRLGRLLIPLYLVSKDILRHPILYLSAYFEANRGFYYQRLMDVREKGDLLGWFHFFLDGIISTAKDGVATFNNSIKLERSVYERLNTLGRRQGSAHRLVPYLFRQPIVDAGTVREHLEVTNSTAYKLIEELVRLNILREVPTASRSRQYEFTEYLGLFS